jgi:hypothetical protein
MKSLKKVVVVFCLGLLVFVSACDKTNDNESHTLISIITYLVDSITDEVVTFEYDSQKRLNLYTVKNGKSEYRSQITYSVDGKLFQQLNIINGIEIERTSFTFTDTSITEEYFDKSENNVWIPLGQKQVHFLNSDGQIVKEQNYYNSGIGWEARDYNLLTWTNGNVEKYETWLSGARKKSVLSFLNRRLNSQVYNSGLKSTSDYKYLSVSLAYDDKNNPYSAFGIIAGTNGFIRNNVIKETFSKEGQAESIVNYSYEYDDSNYPIKIIATWEINGTIITETALFEYTTR